MIKGFVLIAVMGINYQTLDDNIYPTEKACQHDLQVLEPKAKAQGIELACGRAESGQYASNYASKN